MKKLMSLLVVIMILTITISVSAEDRGQFVLGLKTPGIDLGKGVDLTSKMSIFMMSEFNQKWFSLGLNKGPLDVYAGMVSDWAPDEASGMAGVKLSSAIAGNWSCQADNSFLYIKDSDVFDYYSFATIEYNGLFRGHEAFIGPHIEVVRMDGLAKLWAGAHAGFPDLAELGFFYHDADDWQLRAVYTHVLSF